MRGKMNKMERIQPGYTCDTTAQFISGIGGELIEVTSLNRVDPTWQYIDVQGHLHRWYSLHRKGRVVIQKPATSYTPLKRYTLPTLVLITDYPATEEYPAITHYECRRCRSEARNG